MSERDLATADSKTNISAGLGGEAWLRSEGLAEYEMGGHNVRSASELTEFWIFPNGAISRSSRVFTPTEKGRETDLTRRLGTPAHAAKVSKFLLATGELMQFRHLNEPQTIDEEEEALGGDGW